MAKHVNPPVTPDLLSPDDVAIKLGLSTKTVRRMIAAKKLPAHRIGRQLRILPSDLIAFINRGRTMVSL